MMGTDEMVLLILRLALALLLYIFLAAIFVILWRDLRRSAVREIPPRREGFLVVVESGEQGPSPGTIFPLREVNSLGRTPANTVVLSDPFVSAHHALLTWREGHWWLEDLGSKNGTLLNNERIARPTIVGAGDLIGIGQVLLRLEIGEGEPAERPCD